MDNIKKIREERNSALETMRDIHASFEGKSLSDEAEANWNDAKETFEAKTKILEREELLENQRKDASMRNHNDGEASEYADFTFTNAVKYAINPNTLNNSEKGFYAELNQEAEREASNSGVTLQGGSGIVIPTKALKAGFRNGLTIGTEGDDITFEERGGFIDAIRKRMVLTELGVEMMEGLVGDVKFARESNVPTFTWEGETDANAESNPTYDNVTLSPNRGGTYVDVSNQALKQTSPSVERRLIRQLVGSAQRGIESAAINGSTAGPSGIKDVATLVAGSGDFGHIVDIESAVANNNADVGSLGYLTNTKVRGILKQTLKDAGSGRFVWEDDEMNGYRALVSNLVLEDSDGAPENSPVFFGNFADVMIGMWGGMEILVDPYTQATSGMTRLVQNVYADVQIANDESFAYGEIETTPV